MPSIEITVKRDELAKTLAANRDAHLKAYEEALAGWRDRLVAEATKAATAAKVGEIKSWPRALSELTDVPRCHVEEYDRIIRMLKVHTEDTLALNTKDFQRFVDDDWDWKDHWSASNSKYLSQE